MQINVNIIFHVRSPIGAVLSSPRSIYLLDEVWTGVTCQSYTLLLPLSVIPRGYHGPWRPDHAGLSVTGRHCTDVVHS